MRLNPMKQQTIYDLGFGYCKGDGYQRPVVRGERFYCPVCGERIRTGPRHSAVKMRIERDSRPIER